MTQVKISAIAVHIAGWLLFLSLPLLFLLEQPGNENAFILLQSPYYWLFNFSFLLLFYVNAYVLIPAFYLRKKYFSYTAIVLALFAIFYVAKPFDRLFIQHRRPSEVSIHNRKPPEDFRPPANSHAPMGPPRREQPKKVDVVSIFLFMMLLALGMAMQTAHQWRLTEKRAVIAEADKAQAELSFLKAQINPHFLFNTLNNIYSLAVTKNENTAASIMKLSNIMRYVTDDAGEDFVSLQNEVDCIRDYIDLQSLRLSKQVQVDFSVSGNVDHQIIAPLLLMTFVENVFKYGISNHEKATITIKLFAEVHTITFFCQNKRFTTGRSTERTGIGIANTKQRLAHLYPNKHILNITQDNDLFTVQLTLQT